MNYRKEFAWLMVLLSLVFLMCGVAFTWNSTSFAHGEVVSVLWILFFAVGVLFIRVGAIDFIEWFKVAWEKQE